MNNDIGTKFVRLSTGEDLIAHVFEYKTESDQYYELHDPLKVLYLSSSTGGYAGLSISLMQWVLHHVVEDQRFIIYPSDVITMSNPTKSMTEYYHSSVSHFERMKSKKGMEKSYESIEEEPTDASEGLELLRDLLEEVTGKDKKTIH